MGSALQFHRHALGRVALSMTAALALCLLGASTAAATPTAPAGPQTTAIALGVNGANDQDYTLATPLLVDPNTGNVYVLDFGGDQVLVFDPSGSSLGAVALPGPPRALAVDPDSGQVWVSLGNGTSDEITSFSPTAPFTLSSTTYPLPQTCPGAMYPVSGYIWFAANTCGFGHLAVLDEATGTVTDSNAIAIQRDFTFTADPSQPDTMYLIDDADDVRAVDISDPTTPVTSAGTFAPPAGINCGVPLQLAWSVAQDRLLIDCYDSGVVATGDGFSDPVLQDASTSGLGVAVGPTGDVATSGQWSAEPDVDVYAAPVSPATAGTPLEQLTTTTDATDYRSLVDGSFAFSPDGNTLYDLHYDQQGMVDPMALNVTTNATTPTGYISLTNPPATGSAHEPLTIAGTFTLTDDPAASAGVPLAVSIQQQGSANPPVSDTVTTGTGGAFSYASTAPDTPGTYVYTFSYGGDATHAAFQVTATVAIALPTPTLTLTDAAHITYGAKDAMLAHITGFEAGDRVTLYAGSTAVATAGVGPLGNAAFTVAPKATTVYHVGFAGDPGWAPATSTNHTVTVAFSYRGTMVGGYAESKTNYRLYHFETACGGSAHKYCPVFEGIVAPYTSAEVDLQYQEYLKGAWRDMVDRGVHLATNGTYRLLIYYTSRAVENIPMRARISYVPPSASNAAVYGAWTYFKVTT